MVVQDREGGGLALGNGHGNGEQLVPWMFEVNLMTPRDGLDTRAEEEGGGGQSWAFAVSNRTPEMGEPGQSSFALSRCI